MVVSNLVLQGHRVLSSNTAWWGESSRDQDTANIGRGSVTNSPTFPWDSLMKATCHLIFAEEHGHYADVSIFLGIFY